MRLIAARQSCGDYGRVHGGEVFTVPDRVGRDLIARGLANLYEPAGEPPALTALRRAVMAAERELNRNRG